MKPLGLTPFFQVVHPTPGQNAVWRAVEEAIDSGMTPRQFKIEAAEAWETLLGERGKDAAKELLRGEEK